MSLIERSCSPSYPKGVQSVNWNRDYLWTSRRAGISTESGKHYGFLPEGAAAWRKWARVRRTGVSRWADSRYPRRNDKQDDQWPRPGCRPDVRSIAAVRCRLRRTDSTPVGCTRRIRRKVPAEYRVERPGYRRRRQANRPEETSGTPGHRIEFR